MTSATAVVLAAGYSSRMSEFKPVAAIDGRPLLERVVAGLHDVGVADVVVVAGHHAEEVVELARRLDARSVVNERYADGMYTSVRTGIGAVDEASAKVLLLPVDCGLVRPETIGRLLRAAACAPGLVHYPTFEGDRGHPPLIDAVLRRRILDERPSVGLRGLLATCDDEAVDVLVSDPAVLMDIDTDDQLRVARDYAAGARVPGAQECQALLRAQSLPARVIAHSQAVAGVGRRLTRQLNDAGQHLCLALVEAGCLLHDICRPQPDHAAAGAALLDRLGFRRVGALVARHLDIEPDPAGGVGEAEIVYLADKLVDEDGEVGLAEKLARRRAALAARPDGVPFMEARMAVALEIERRIQEIVATGE